MKSEIIRAENLSKEYHLGEQVVHALNGVNIAICEGSFVAVMGASGSGKSTFLNMLGCLDEPSGGKYFLNGIDIGLLSRKERAAIRNQKLGFVFQSFNLLSRTSALENVELPLLYSKNKMSVAERSDKAKAMLELVGLSDRMKHVPSQLSGGQQQRVAIARALVNDPILILADEATGNLDSKTSIEIMELMTRLNEKGITIVFVTHDDEIADWMGRKLEFRDGIVLEDIISTPKPQGITS
ncbi:MAG: ABC transporter ATP-binding protein [Bacteroidetes bacterium HGW-Bacteroidetes-6]|jgi:putative ABC transport system ATP-binding protein|nr:MAG: ABC transporter ATP-binding protein [Bacteroidetes bacterium HGW-Bacteroidetes-6]